MRQRATLLAAGLLSAAALVAAACDDGGAGAATGAAPDVETSESPTADHAFVEKLRAQRDWPKDPSDGGGRGWFAQPDPARVVASTAERFEIVYEVGPEGVAAGGAITLQLPRVGAWSVPRLGAEGRRGYTRVESDPPGARLRAGAEGRKLRIEALEALAPGTRLRIHYGAGPRKARTGRYAAEATYFWISVDGDGDGVGELVADSPVLAVLPTRPTRVHVALESVVRPGDPVRVSVALFDTFGNAGLPVTGEVTLTGGEGLELPAAVTLGPEDAGVGIAVGRAVSPGVYRVHAQAGELSGESNPLLVSTEAPRILWADLHGHSQRSDGTGTPEHYFRYARDVAALDVVALTDHDHHGPLYLDGHPESWREIEEATLAFNDPGHFVTLLGYEWTSWIHGHRHVLFFGNGGRVRSFLDPETDTPRELWQSLAGEAAITIAHHSAGGPMATNWEIPPDPTFEPVTEIVSTHGSSESADTPARIGDAVDGNYVRDALARGYQLGFVGSGDTHNGHPGLAHVRSRSGGLAAILSEELTREGVLDALRARRVYATNGPRIALQAQLAGNTMGAVLPADTYGESPELAVRVLAVEPLDRVDVVRAGAVVETVPGEGRVALDFTRALPPLTPGEYVYVRAVQRDGGAAWSSPFFAE